MQVLLDLQQLVMQVDGVDHVEHSVELRKPLLHVLHLLALNQTHQLTKVVQLKLAQLHDLTVPSEVTACAVVLVRMEVQARLALIASGTVYTHVLYISLDVVSLILRLLQQSEHHLPAL